MREGSIDKKGLSEMRRIGRRSERYTAKRGSARPALTTQGKYQRIWMETELRAKAWSKKHRGNEMNAEAWNALWERVRDELYGSAWVCERARGYASIAEGVMV